MLLNSLYILIINFQNLQILVEVLHKVAQIPKTSLLTKVVDTVYGSTDLFPMLISEISNIIIVNINERRNYLACDGLLSVILHCFNKKYIEISKLLEISIYIMSIGKKLEKPLNNYLYYPSADTENEKKELFERVKLVYLIMDVIKVEVLYNEQVRFVYLLFLQLKTQATIRWDFTTKIKKLKSEIGIYQQLETIKDIDEEIIKQDLTIMPPKISESIKNGCDNIKPFVYEEDIGEEEDAEIEGDDYEEGVEFSSEEEEDKW